jgi:hypothetical protein
MSSQEMRKLMNIFQETQKTELTEGLGDSIERARVGIGNVVDKVNNAKDQIGDQINDKMTDLKNTSNDKKTEILKKFTTNAIKIAKTHGLDLVRFEDPAIFSALRKYHIQQLRKRVANAHFSDAEIEHYIIDAAKGELRRAAPIERGGHGYSHRTDLTPDQIINTAFNNQFVTRNYSKLFSSLRNSNVWAIDEHNCLPFSFFIGINTGQLLAFNDAKEQWYQIANHVKPLSNLFGFNFPQGFIKYVTKDVFGYLGENASVAKDIIQMYPEATDDQILTCINNMKNEER